MSEPRAADDAGTTHHIRVDEPTGERLDRYLSEKLGLSRSRVASLIESGHVRIGERVPKKSDVAEPGDLIEVLVPPPEPSEAVPQDIPLDIVYEDESLLVIDKPAGLVVHPAPGHGSGTLVNALLHHVPNLSGIGGVRRPGIVHRLDKDTSGLMIVAKVDTAHSRLSQALSEREISRVYLAACWGHLKNDQMVIEAEIGRHPRDRKRMAVVPGGRPAVTRVQRLETWTAADLLRVELDTGRTHQIRVHLHHVGHPVVGDPVYGQGRERGFSSGAHRWAGELARRVPRQFLHATELRFRHPIEDRALVFTSPLAEDLRVTAEWARTR